MDDTDSSCSIGVRADSSPPSSHLCYTKPRHLSKLRVWSCYWMWDSDPSGASLTQHGLLCEQGADQASTHCFSTHSPPHHHNGCWFWGEPKRPTETLNSSRWRVHLSVPTPTGCRLAEKIVSLAQKVQQQMERLSSKVSVSPRWEQHYLLVISYLMKLSSAFTPHHSELKGKDWSEEISH